MQILQDVYLSCYRRVVREQPPLDEAAELFKVLGNTSRLWLLVLLGEEEHSVGALTRITGMSQPLVSQHLRTLRQSGLATAVRQGKGVVYHLTDAHVSHVITDALAHVQEAVSDQEADTRTEGSPMNSRTHAEHESAEHTLAEHTHGDDCGHEAVQHGDHVDYRHDDHQHALHDDHYDEH